MYSKTLFAGWGDMDFNSHMRNTAYLDKAADVRQMFLMEHGFPMEELARLRIGPVVRRDEVDYFRELQLLQPARVRLLVGGLSEDASRVRIVNEIVRGDGELAARITTLNGWLDLAARKLVAPPAPLADALRALEHTADFEVLPSSVR